MIIKNELRQNYSPIPNAIITDTSISHGALRVYCYIASKPETWDVVHTEIQETLKISRNSLTTYAKELLASGWISRKIKSLQNGKLNGGYVYTLHCVKQTQITETECTNFDVSKSVQTATDSPKIDMSKNGETAATDSPNFGHGGVSKKPFAQNLTPSNTDIDRVNNKVSKTDSIKKTIAFNFDGFNEAKTEAIKKWFLYRKEIGKPYKSQLTLDQMRGEFLVNDNLVRDIHWSIAKGYQGIYPAPVQHQQQPAGNDPLKRCNSQVFSGAF